MMTETVVTVTNSESNPAHHNTPTVKSDPGQGQTQVGIRVNINYFKTIPGILKLVQVVFGIVCMSCASPAILSGTHWFLFVAVTTFIATLCWVFIYLLSIREALKLPIDWILTELMNTGIATLLYLIAFIVQLSVWSPYGNEYGWKAKNIAAGVFGIFNTIAYAAGTFFLYMEWKNSRAN